MTNRKRALELYVACTSCNSVSVSTPVAAVLQCSNLLNNLFLCADESTDKDIIILCNEQFVHKVICGPRNLVLFIKKYIHAYDKGLLIAYLLNTFFY